MIESKFFPNKIIQVFALFLSSLILVFPFFIIFKIDEFANSDLLKTLWFILVNSTFIILTVFINFRRKQKLELHFEIIRFKYLYLMLLVVLIFQVGINIPINNILEQLWPISTKPNYTKEGLYIVLGAITIGPVFEEIIFRGIILKGLLTRYSVKVSILLSSLMFGLIHLKPEQIWGAILLGLFFGFIYFKTKSVGTVILLHSFANICVFVFKYFQASFNLTYFNLTVFVLLSVSSSIVIFFIIRRLITGLKIEFLNN